MTRKYFRFLCESVINPVFNNRVMRKFDPLSVAVAVLLVVLIIWFVLKVAGVDV